LAARRASTQQQRIDVAFLLTELPLTVDASLWWAPRSFVALAVVAAIGVYGFRTALAGKPAFGGDWLET